MKRFVFSSLLATQLLFGGVALAAPTAILTRVSGSVRIVRGGRVIPAREGLPLQNGDRISTVAGGGATIFSLAGAPRRLSGASSVVVGAAGVKQKGATSPLWKGVYQGLARGLGSDNRSVAATMRRVESDIVLLEPARGLIETSRPHFLWRARSLDAAQYEITVSDAQDQVVWHARTAKTSLLYNGAAPLRGALSWKVSPLELKNGAWKPIAGQTSDAARFQIASNAQIAGLRAGLWEFESQSAFLNPRDRILSRAALLRTRGFKNAALRELERGGNEAATVALRELLWRESGQDWRFKTRPTPTGRADAAILTYSPSAPFQIEERKIYRAPGGAFSMEIPYRFSVARRDFDGVATTAFGVASQEIASPDAVRMGLIMAPARTLSRPDALRIWMRANAAGRAMRFETAREILFRGHKARISAWSEQRLGVTSRGQWLEWSEGARRLAAVWGAPDPATASALQSLFESLQLDVAPAPALAPQAFDATVTKLMEDAVSQMQGLKERSMERSLAPQSSPTLADLERLELARLQAPANSHARASAALQASRAAAHLAWSAGDAAPAARAFERRAALDEESYRAELGALDADLLANQSEIARLSRLTPAQNFAQSYGIALDVLLSLRRMILAQKQLLALPRGDARALDATARALFELHRGQLEAIRLGVVKSALAPRAQELEHRLRIAEALEDLGDAAQEGADLDAARAYFSRALEWRRALPHDAPSRDVSQSLRNRGSLEAALGDGRLARSFFEQALREWDKEAPARERTAATRPEAVREIERAGALQNRAVMWNNLGFVLQNGGDLGAAENAYQKALHSVDALPSQGFSGTVRASMQAVALGNLSVLRADSGDLESAEEVSKRAVAILRALGNDRGLALSLLNGAGLSYARGDLENAATKVADARALFVQLQQPKLLLNADIFAAKLARKRGNFALATSRARDALVLARSVGDEGGIAAAARAVARARLEAAPAGALSSEDQTTISVALDEAATADARSGLAFSQISTIHLRARWQRRSGDLDAALQGFKAAIARFERVRATTGSESGAGEKISDLEENRELYDDAVRLLLQMKRPGEAFDMLGRARSQKLRESLRLSALQSGDLELQKWLDRAASLDEKLVKTRARLAEVSALPAPQRDAVAIENLKDLIASTQAEFFEVSAQIKAKNPRFDQALSLSPRELKKAQRAIPAGVLLLEYAALDDGLYIFAVTRDGLKIYAPQVSKQELQSAVRAYRGAIDADLARLQKGETPVSIDAQSPLRSASESLSASLLAPVQSDIDAARLVAIVPSGELFYLPFHALGKTTKNGEWRFLIEEKPLAYLAAGDILSIAAPQDDEREGRGILALGDPTGADLPAARAEVEAIARLFPDSRALTGASASKAAMLLPSSRNKRMLHLAAHGVLDSARPDQSFIQLSPSRAEAGKPRDDGKLRVGEIYGLDLSRVDLVTLSACQTALGQGSPDGSEISSLAQSFSSAGTPSVVASLWSVEDQSTARLMQTFYGALANGTPKGEALQKAQIALLRDPKTRHPLFWAPFELLGDWR